MATNKRRRICGLDSSKLAAAYQSLSALQNAMNDEDTITEGESEDLIQEHEGHQVFRSYCVHFVHLIACSHLG